MKFKFFLALILLFALPAKAQERKDGPLDLTEYTDITEHLNTFVDTSLEFTNQDGEKKPLKDFFIPNRPTIITPVYFNCPNLCTFTLNGTLKMLNEIKLKLGDDFNVMSISIDPTEGPELSLVKANNYYKEMTKPERGKAGWLFMTGQAENVTKLMNQLGFSYQKDGPDYIHTAAIMVLTPKGKISRYFYGVEYKPKDVKFSLVEASKGKIGSTLDKVLLNCFTFDPTLGKYTPQIWKITRIFCIGFSILVAVLIIVLKLKERKEPHV